MIEQYDPDNGHDAESWIAMDEQARIELIKSYHEKEKPHPEAPNPHLHAVFHNIIETQACVDERVKKALERMVGDGLTRHNAIHAAASIVQKYIQAALSKQEPVDEEAYVEELEAFDANDWATDKG